jgi:short-subunit dehydrogenase
VALPPPAAGSTCVVTGASSGIGADIARELARRGFGVTLVARREERLRELADELVETFAVRAEVVAVDVTDPEARKALADLTVDVLVNNAGFGSGGAFAEQEVERETLMVRTNVEALIGLTGMFLPGMLARGRGAILNVASLIAFQPVPYQATYGATKAAVLSFSEALHHEVRGRGVTVTAVCPGPVHTEFGESGGFGGDDERIPDRLWLESEKVAADAVRGLENGDRVVVPGLRNQVLALYGHYLPRSVLLPLLRYVYPVGR